MFNNDMSTVISRKKIVRIFRWLKNRNFVIKIEDYHDCSTECERHHCDYTGIIKDFKVITKGFYEYDVYFTMKDNSKGSFYIPVDAEFKNIYNPKGTKIVWNNGDGTYSYVRITVIDERVEDQRGLREFD